jgi:NADPH:quinone reductase
MKAIVNDAGVTEHFVLTDVTEPAPAPNQALVRVAAVSLNRGEVRMAMASQNRYVPGWDLAGMVEQPAADGSGPKAGARVVGYMGTGAWAERAAVYTKDLAELPQEVSFAQASTLPVAGLTALNTMAKAGNIAARSVLITGASGGVGLFAVELARLAGASEVVGLTHHSGYEKIVLEAGATHVVNGEDASGAAPYGPYNLLLDSVGSKVLVSALALMAPYSTAVTFGTTGGQEATIQTGQLYRSCVTLIGFLLTIDLKTESASSGLARLAKLVAEGRLHPRIEVEASWKEAAAVAKKLIDRQYAGKAVLHID